MTARADLLEALAAAPHPTYVDHDTSDARAASVLRTFMPAGRLDRIPTSRSKRLVVLLLAHRRRRRGLAGRLPNRDLRAGASGCPRWHCGRMFDTITGLPVHALVVHAVVILVPLSALGVVAIAVVPKWRTRYGALVLAVTTAGLATVPVATRSGRQLRDRIDAGGVVKDQIENHVEWGERVLWPTLALWVLTVALVLLTRRGGTGRAVMVVAVLAVVAAGVAGGTVAKAGHLGSTAVWSCTIGSDACKRS